MLYIIGLGNPGRVYEFTRHNVGKLFVLYLGEGNFLEGEGHFFYKETDYGILIVPNLYMNESGKVFNDLKKNSKWKLRKSW